MKTLLAFAAAVMVLTLDGCAGMGSSEATCRGNSVCPIVIYEKVPGVFATFPEKMHIYSDQTTGANYPTLIFTFADQAKYKFLAKTAHVGGDGVDLVNAIGTVIGVNPCFITNNSKKPLSSAGEGPYLRCEIRNKASFPETQYTVRFHDMGGKQLKVDPVVDSTGGGDIGAMAAMTTYGYLLVPVGQDGQLPPLGGNEAIKVAWDAGAGGTFRDGEGYVTFKDATGTPVPISNCYISTDAQGSDISSDSRYYVCLIAYDGKFSLVYTASYRNTLAGMATLSGKIYRP